MPQQAPCRKQAVAQTDYVNISQVPNVRVLPLGTDNFGRDVLTELVSASSVHRCMIGLVAGLIATFIGLTAGPASRLYRRYGG